LRELRRRRVRLAGGFNVAGDRRVETEHQRARPGVAASTTLPAMSSRNWQTPRGRVTERFALRTLTAPATDLERGWSAGAMNAPDHTGRAENANGAGAILPLLPFSKKADAV
jgi:hypothetical protein